MAGQVLQHGQQVAHGLAQQPVVDQEDKQGDRESDGELEESGNDSAEDTTLDGTVTIESLPANIGKFGFI